MRAVVASLLRTVVIVWVCLAAASATAQAQPADLVLIDGRVVTLDSVLPLAEAIAIRDGRIMAIGTSPMIRAMTDGHTRVLNLAGHTVIPGLIVSQAAPQATGIPAFFRELNSFAITGLLDPDGRNLSADDYRALLQLWRERQLTVRVGYGDCAPRPDDKREAFEALAAAMPIRRGDDWLRFNDRCENGAPGIHGGDGHPASGNNPFVSMQRMLDRGVRPETDRRARRAGPTREQALRIFTLDGAQVAHTGDRQGSLSVGKFADLAVLNADYLTIPMSEVSKLTSILTVVGGKIVYAAGIYQGLDETKSRP